MTRLLRNNRLVIGAEVCERVYNGHHLPAELGEPVLNAGRVFTIVVAKDEAVILQLAQAVGKHLLRDMSMLVHVLENVVAPRPRMARLI